MTSEEPGHLGEPGSTLRSAMGRFLLLSLAALLLAGTTLVLVTRDFAGDEALRDATHQTQAIADRIAAPVVTRAVRRDPAVASRRLGEELANHLRDGSVSHMLLWDPSGRVLWADDPRLTGRTFDLPPDVEALFGTHRTLSDTSDEHTRLPGSTGDATVEVYAGAVDADGEPFVFEAYVPRARVGVERDALVRRILPTALGGLVLLQLLLLPLAWSLARRVDRGRDQRLRLVRRSLAYWHEERRRLAQELHDTVVQDVATAGLGLPLVVESLPSGAAGEQARDVAERLQRALERSVAACRNIVTDLFPATLDGTGLTSALDDLARAARARGLHVDVEAADDLGADAAVAGLVYRLVREALRNVEKHAGAERAWVAVSAHEDSVRVEVGDDGRGMSQASAGSTHVGLRMLRTLVADVGGRLEVVDRPGGGTVLRADLPRSPR